MDRMPGGEERDLRDDVRQLGAILGETLSHKLGAEFFDLVEEVRRFSKDARGGDAEASAKLRDRLGTLDVDVALPLARAFAHFLALANVAEQHHRIRRRRAYRRDPSSPPQRGSCEETFGRLLERGVDPDTLHAAVSNLSIDLVLTAHPTEVARRTILRKYAAIAERLGEFDRTDLTLGERAIVEEGLRREVTSIWETDDVRREAPTPEDEARSGFAVIEQTLWEALPRYLRGVDRALHRFTGRNLGAHTVPVRFSSWMGGDRDGNPNVTADVTRRVLLLARWVAADLFGHEVDQLRGELSMSRASDELTARAGGAEEPYREILRPIRDRLFSVRRALEHALVDPESVAATDWALESEELEEPLLLCDRSLRETGNAIIADGRLTDLLRRAAAFGPSLVRLDLRQDASRHDETMAEIVRALDLGDWTAWDEEARIGFLAARLDDDAPLFPEGIQLSDPATEVIATFRMAASFPEDSFGAYVISMASRVSDVLTVELLKKAAGVGNTLRTVPLFETVGDLERCGAVLDRLFAIDAYVARIGGRQEVMIGYSDSGKESGRLAASWALYRAQETIVRCGEKNGVEMTLFHGRGGTVGRGGGPTYLAMQSQPPGSIRGSIRLTEQGEMIQAKFGLPGIAIRTLEVYTSATLDATLTPPLAPKPEWRERMDALVAVSRAAYRAIVFDRDDFVPYFRLVTPETELGSLNIGSRPARRARGSGVESLRAIPWVFAWMQTRLLLPSWLGTDEALGSAVEEGHRDELREMYESWPFFRSAIDLVEMVLAKADLMIASEYDRQLVPDALRPIGHDLIERLPRIIDAVQDVTGHAELLEENPVLRRSIRLRNPYVDPINLIQIELLRRLRAEVPAEGVEELREALLVTINGVAAGMRNTG